MSVELKYLLWALILALIQIILASFARTFEVGLFYNASPRDIPSAKPVGKTAGRLARAQSNFFETFPIFIGLILIVQTAHLNNEKTLLGAMLYFWARVAYVPAYVAGIPYVRTIIWAVSLYGLIQLIEVLVGALA